MMRRDVPPSVQSSEIPEATLVRRIGRRQVERQTESIEIPTEIIPARVASIEGEACRELRLDHDLQCGRQGRGDDLGAFRVEVATESLEMGAQEHDAAPEI